MSAAEPAIFLSAGETSGDRYAGSLAAELRRRRPGLRLLGLGGARMRGAGVELLEDLDRLAVLGVAEVVAHLPFFLRLRRRVRRRLVREPVDLLVLVDYPGFNLPLARFAHGRGIPVLYYVAPQVWAWHRSRIRELAAVTDRLCVVLPFEEELFRRAGARAEFVGHPLLDELGGPEAPPAAAGPDDPSEAAPRPAGPVLGLFPGSREQEVRRLLPTFLAAARRVGAERSGLRVRVARSPHLPAELYREVARGGAAGETAFGLADAGTVTRGSTAALTKSGTMTLELALHGTPMVVAYRMHRLTFWLARRLVEVDHIALVNLVAGRRVVPERVQEAARPELLAADLAPLLAPEHPDRRRMVRELAAVAGSLGSPGVAGRVARRALELLTARGAGR